MLELKIEISETHPHQSLDTCICLVDMLRELFTDRRDFESLTDKGVMGIILQLQAMETAMTEIRNAVQAKMYSEDKPSEQAVTPRLTEPKGRRAAAA